MNIIKKGNKERESNMELLRIIAIILIIIFHITLHGITPQLTESSLYAPNTFFNHFCFYKKLLIIQTFYTFGDIGNSLFILISGYYLISKKKINLEKPIKKLLSQLIFATSSILLLSFLWFKLFNPSFDGLTQFYAFNTEYWFIGYYLAIIIIAALVLNKRLNKFTHKEYKIFLLIILAIISISWLGGLFDGLSKNLRTLLAGIFYYSAGGYIKKYNPMKNIRSIFLILTIIITIIIVWLSYYNNTITNINNALFLGETKFYQTLSNFGAYSIISIILSICIFELFRRIKIPNKKIINYIASSTFMIYLIHESKFIIRIYDKIEWIPIYYSNTWQFILILFEWIGIILVLGIIIYSIYILLTKIIKTNVIKKVIFKNHN